MKFLGKVETVIVLIFLALLVAYGAVKCNQTKATFEEVPEETEEVNVMDENSEAVLPKLPQKKDPSLNSMNHSGPKKGAYSILFIQIDSLNMRQGPSLDSAVVARLNFNEEVYFLGQRTDFKQKINMLGETKNEPWVLIETTRGKRGWVYGGGVHYYQRKR